MPNLFQFLKSLLPQKFDTEITLLTLLWDHGAMYGVEIQDATGFSYGRIYATMQNLENKGLVRGYSVEGGPERGYRPKRYFYLTREGEQVVLP